MMERKHLVWYQSLWVGQLRSEVSQITYAIMTSLKNNRDCVFD